MTNNRHDNSFGYGLRIGYLGEVLRDLSVGGSFQTKIYMSAFDKYAGLLAEESDFDIPATWTAELAYRLNPVLTLVAEVQQILCGGIKSVNNPMDPSSLNPTLNPGGFIPFGSDQAAGFGWEDMTVFAFGVQHEGVPVMALRTGYSFADQPILKSEI